MSATASTQAFTEIVDIIDNLVIFTGNTAALVIEISSTNFALLSLEEQEAKVSAYASFLNSLAFPIQILVRNRRVDISSYITLLQGEIAKITNIQVAEYLQKYKDFVQELVQKNIVLDKNFYLVVPYSSLEAGAVSSLKSVNTTITDDFVEQAKIALHTKADGLQNQIGRLNLQTKILGKDELIKLFYTMYNPSQSIQEEL